MKPVVFSDEFLSLQEADSLIREHRRSLYADRGYLPLDVATQAAFGALCGASRYIERLMVGHLTGTQIEKNTNENAARPPSTNRDA